MHRDDNYLNSNNRIFEQKANSVSQDITVSNDNNGGADAVKVPLVAEAVSKFKEFLRKYKSSLDQTTGNMRI
jgi:hypothetical protein